MLQAIPGTVVILAGAGVIVGRNVAGSGSGVVRTLFYGRPSTEAERRGDSLLPIVFGVGMIIAGFWVLVYTYVLR